VVEPGYGAGSRSCSANSRSDLIIAQGRDELARFAVSWRKANDRLQAECNRLQATVDDLLQLTTGGPAPRLVTRLARRTIPIPLVAGLVVLGVASTIVIMPRPVPPPPVDNAAMINAATSAATARCTAQFAAEQAQMQAQIRIMYRQLTEQRRSPPPAVPAPLCAFPREFAAVPDIQP
jgi:hypothetical protein